MNKELLDFMTWVNQDKKLGYTSIGIERIVNRYITSKEKYNQIIDGVEYELTPKRVLTDEEFIKYVLEKNKIDFNVGDIVWYKGENIRKECGKTKFKVLSIETYLIDGNRVDCYLNVNLKSLTSGDKVSFFTSHLEKYNGVDFVKEIIIDGIDYQLTPKQK